VRVIVDKKLRWNFIIKHLILQYFLGNPWRVIEVSAGVRSVENGTFDKPAVKMRQLGFLCLFSAQSVAKRHAVLYS
jgi:hypothetical protein